jgi:hypothetical protein
MHSKTFLAVFALATSVIAAPLPNDIWGAEPSQKSGLQEISDILGSPFGNGNKDGNGNAAGNGNDGNVRFLSTREIEQSANLCTGRRKWRW